MLFRLALLSLLNRRGSVLLTVMAITVSVFVVIGVEHLRHQTKASFSKTVSGVDLIVGARSGDINLLLYSVFRMGNASNNIRWTTFKDIQKLNSVEWVVPISLGDSHKGYRVVGTNSEYFDRFKYGSNQSLTFSDGKPFKELFDVVLGANIAASLNYQIGDTLVLAHGIAATSFSLHDDKPFRVVGILAPTGTPVDQSLHVSLAGIEAIHVDWKSGVKIPSRNTANEQLTNLDLTPKSITAMMVGLKSKLSTFKTQRQLNNYKKEPLSAILPGVALSELWQMMSMMEQALRLISALVLAASLLGLGALLLGSIREREREIAILRTLGAHPLTLFLLIQIEATLITLTAMATAIIGLYVTISMIGNYLSSEFGLFISRAIINTETIIILPIVLIASLIISTIPSTMAYQRSLNSQLSAK